MTVHRIFFLILMTLGCQINAFAERAEGNFSPSSILIFVSFSMPRTSLKSWIKEANQIKAPVIIRGLLNNSFKDTTNALADLVKDNPGGLQIDPLLFKKFNIQKVPALVVTNREGDFDVIYGNVTLEYALNQIARQNDSLSDIAKDALLLLKEAN